ncbi:hypothetical protein LZ32DRAFT_664378 [Colletotrichum eremochloae]|nr:hypothetical protein LZ32DRAFT_664378 [Colletotrichum eremochloae]
MSIPTVSPRPDAPFDFGALLIQGYFEHPNKPYKIPGPKSDLILLPPQYASELGTYSDQQLSFGSAIHDFWMSKYTTWRYHLDDETGRRTLMGSLKGDGANVVSLIDKEIERAFTEWEHRYFQLNEKDRAGRDASNDGWVHAASGVGMKLMLAARDLRELHGWLQPVIKHFLPSYRSLMAARRKLAKKMAPLVKEHLLQHKDSEGKTHNMIAYQLQHSKGWRATDVDFEVGQIFDNVFAGDSK